MTQYFKWDFIDIVSEKDIFFLRRELIFFLEISCGICDFKVLL